MIGTLDTTITRCPYCNGTNYVCREIQINGLTQYAPKVNALEIYCASCRRTLSITPITPVE